MFKRILVLVLFLSLVFWWLSSRNDDQVETPDTNTETQTKVEATSEGEAEKASEGEETTEAESEEGTENAETEATTEKEATVETTPEVPAVTTPQTTYRPPAKRVVTVPDVQTNVKVYLYEWNMDMSNKTISSGTVNFQVQNDGRFTHDFSINGYGNLGKVNPGQSQTFTLKLRPGTYEAFSDRRQDYERGVKSSFTVK